jgi:hypothetical protein
MTTTTAYRERLVPTWWAWLIAVSLVAMVGIAYGAALGATAGWIVGIVGVVLVVALIWVTSPVVAVTPGSLDVGSARLPLTSIESAEEVDAAQIAALRGPGADARLFTALRPWSCREGVLVRLADDADPHPAWLFSSRHPARMVSALDATMGH